MASLSTIASASFSITPRSDGYALTVQFLDDMGHGASQKEFPFIFQRCVDGRTVDIASINAEAHSKAATLRKKTFCEEDISEIADALRISQDERAKDDSQVVAVIDFRNSGGGYANKDVIQTAEETVFKYLHDESTEETSTIAKARKIFHESDVQFVIREGSLKADLIRSGSFSPDEIEFFFDRRGGQYLCQTTEFFMNAIKFGHIPTSIGGWSPQDYLYPLSDEACFQPYSRSIVVYPPSYHDMALRGAYSSAMRTSRVFSAALEERDGSVEGCFYVREPLKDTSTDSSTEDSGSDTPTDLSRISLSDSDGSSSPKDLSHSTVSNDSGTPPPIV